jgi:DNA-directed RNA polymerase specialized sigma24 family protein
MAGINSVLTRLGILHLMCPNRELEFGEIDRRLHEFLDWMRRRYKAQARGEVAEVRAREGLAQAREAHAAELREARGAAAREREEALRLTWEVEALREELATVRDRSREALIREAQHLQATHGWRASELGRHLGWPESTVRGLLLAARAARAAD